MKYKNIYCVTTLLIGSAFALSACDTQMAKNDLPEMSADRFEAHVRYLASDEMGGRDTGSTGYQMAADYVAKNFADMGLKPGGENGTYFQTVNFRSTSLDAANSSASLTLAGNMKDLVIGSDIVMNGSAEAAEIMGSGDLVFVGYGIDAPEYGINDFAGVDVTGKIIVRLYGTPDSLPSDVAAVVNGNKRAPGAAGVIELYNSKLQARRGDWDRFKRRFGNPRLGWVGANGTGRPSPDGPMPSANISPELSAQILESIGLSMDTVEDMAVADDFMAQDINGSASITLKSTYSGNLSSPNVIGILEGSDPALKNQYVVISAHLDHVGDQCPRRSNDTATEGDTICNGVMDNASGTATMLEAARAFTSREAPRRSILFVSVTAEEKGLLGADYFAHFPTVDVNALVANVNLDMPVLLYDFADVVAFGSEHSSIGPIAARATARAGINLAEDPMPEQNLFVRSDHYRFVQKGIPSVFLMTGPTEVGEDITKPANERNGYNSFTGFLNTNYHSPADDLMQPIVWSAGAKFALVNYLIINEIANADTEPRWNDGDYFGNLYAPGKPRAK